MTQTGNKNEKLDSLAVQHRLFDDKIAILETEPTKNQLKIQRLKKQKLILKDEISHLKSTLLSDIIE